MFDFDIQIEETEAFTHAELLEEFAEELAKDVQFEEQAEEVQDQQDQAEAVEYDIEVPF